jgi:hypothetical protein
LREREGRNSVDLGSKADAAAQSWGILHSGPLGRRGGFPLIVATSPWMAAFAIVEAGRLLRLARPSRVTVDAKTTLAASDLSGLGL